MTKKAERNHKTYLRWYNPDSLILNITVVVFCVLGGLLSIILVRKDFNNFLLRIEEQPIGIVLSKSGIVQYRSSGRILWGRLLLYSQIHDGDSFRTAVFSGAGMKLENGETVELSENTSVRFHYRHEEISWFELSEGEISVSNDRYSVMISSALGEVSLNPRSRVSVRAGEDLCLCVYQGSAIITGNGQVRRAETGDTLRLMGDGTFSENPRVAVIAPRQEAVFLSPAGKDVPVEFIWRKMDFQDRSALMLEIARDRDFLDLEKSWYGEDVNSTIVDLPPGRYYWRAYIPPAMADAAAGKLDVVQTPEPSALAPADGETFHYVLKNPDIRFNWFVGEEAAGAILEVADNPEMNRPVLLKRVERVRGGVGSFLSSDLDEGIWYWRIRTINSERSEGDARNSAVKSFSIVRYDRLIAPKPLTPAEGTTINAGFGPGLGRIGFSWEPREEAVSYTVLISHDQNLANPLIEESTNHNFFIYNSAIETLDTNLYYWGVYQTDERGIRSATSRPSSFIVQNGNTNPRTIFPPDNYSVPMNRSQDIHFSWKNPLVSTLRFQMAARSDFTGQLIMDETVTGSGIQGRFLKPGVYYWRIISGAANSRIDTPPVRLVIEPALAGPFLESPRPDENLKIEEGEATVFTWQRVSYGDYYRFRLFVEGRTTAISEISSLRDNQIFIYFDTATRGRFRWTVQAFTSPKDNSPGRNGLITESRFTIAGPGGTLSRGGTEVAWAVPRITNIEFIAGQVFSPIILRYPMRGANITGMEALRNPPVARWSADEPFTRVQLAISRESDPLLDPRAIVMNKLDSENSMNFPSLGEGIWYWTISADGMDGRRVSPGDPSWFTVLPISQLPSPVYIQPEDDAVISMAQLTEDRSISFEWEQVNDANAYIFSLFEDGEAPKLIFTDTPEDKTSFVLTELNLLNQDKYLWQAEAVNRNQNGIIEQRGVIEQQRFSIDIRRSGTLQTHGPGNVYGQ